MANPRLQQMDSDRVPNGRTITLKAQICTSLSENAVAPLESILENMEKMTGAAPTNYRFNEWIKDLNASRTTSEENLP